MQIKKALSIAVMVGMLTALSLPCHAGENPFYDTFQSVFYGGLVGAIGGAALLVFTEHPNDHLNYIAYGAAGGVLAGTVYGVLRSSSRSLAEYENGKVKFAIPTVIPELQENRANGQAAVVFNTQLIRGTF